MTYEYQKVSEQTGISADTIRYYERIGLLPRVTRNKSGVRDFQSVTSPLWNLFVVSEKQA